MSGAMMSGGAGFGSKRFAEEFVFRPAFGTRLPATQIGREPMLAVAAARSMDRDVADMRRRIGESAPLLPHRLPLAVAAAVIGGASFVLWRDAFMLAESLAHEAASLY
jgi:hypothetical protein